jgi:hypothetical protein
MPTILKIGYAHYLVRRETDAAAVVKAMAGAVRMEHSFTREHRDRFWPDADHSNEVGIINVRASQIFPCEPGSESCVEVDTPLKKLNGGIQLRLEDKK